MRPLPTAERRPRWSPHREDWVALIGVSLLSVCLLTGLILVAPARRHAADEGVAVVDELGLSLTPEQRETPEPQHPHVAGQSDPAVGPGSGDPTVPDRPGAPDDPDPAGTATALPGPDAPGPPADPDGSEDPDDPGDPEDPAGPDDPAEPGDCGAGSGSGAFAADPGPSAIAGHPASRDAASYAVDFGVSLAEARSRLSRQGSLAALAAEIEVAAGPCFAGAWIDNGPELKLVVRLTEDADPSAVAALAAGAPAPVEIRTDASRSLAQLRAAHDAMAPTLVDELPGAASDVDVRTGALVLLVTNQQRQRAWAVATELGEVEDVPVRVESTEQGYSQQVGGGVGVSPTCTTGFSVVRLSDGDRGFLTAGHCPDDLEYPGPIPSSHQAELLDGSHDAQWNTVDTPTEGYGSFLADGAWRELGSPVHRLQQAVGSYVCHQGALTGYSCGEIQSMSFRPPTAECPGVPMCDAVWMRVEGPRLRCAPGDSGGPVFADDDAYGIHQGGVSAGPGPGQCRYAGYMAISSAGDLGIALAGPDPPAGPELV